MQPPPIPPPSAAAHCMCAPRCALALFSAASLCMCQLRVSWQSACVYSSLSPSFHQGFSNSSLISTCKRSTSWTLFGGKCTWPRGRLTILTERRWVEWSTLIRPRELSIRQPRRLRLQGLDSATARLRLRQTRVNGAIAANWPTMIQSQFLCEAEGTLRKQAQHVMPVTLKKNPASQRISTNWKRHQTQTVSGSQENKRVTFESDRNYDTEDCTKVGIMPE